MYLVKGIESETRVSISCVSSPSANNIIKSVLRALSNTYHFEAFAKIVQVKFSSSKESCLICFNNSWTLTFERKLSYFLQWKLDCHLRKKIVFFASVKVVLSPFKENCLIWFNESWLMSNNVSIFSALLFFLNCCKNAVFSLKTHKSHLTSAHFCLICALFCYFWTLLLFFRLALVNKFH